MAPPLRPPDPLLPPLLLAVDEVLPLPLATAACPDRSAPDPLPPEKLVWGTSKPLPSSSTTTCGQGGGRAEQGFS